MVHAIPDLDGILPYPVLDILRPCRLELLLANRTGSITKGGIVRGTYPLLGRCFLRRTTIASIYSLTGCFCVYKAFIIADLSGFDPILPRVRRTANQIR